ncbi:MAG: class I SAM-dependent methyltransferase [Methanolobus sp.]
MNNSRAEFLVSSITSNPFSDNSFDAVLCLGVMQHLLEDERQEAVSEIKRVMKKGAVLVMEVFGTEDMRYGGEEIEKNTFSRKSGIIYHYFTQEELKNCFWILRLWKLKILFQKSVPWQPTQAPPDKDNSQILESDSKIVRSTITSSAPTTPAIAD